MTPETLKIALACGNRWFMKLEPESDKKITDNPSYSDVKGKFARLKKRQYYGYVSVGDGETRVEGRTEDLPEPNLHSYGYVWSRCKSKLPYKKDEWWFDSKGNEEGAVIDINKYGVKTV